MGFMESLEKSGIILCGLGLFGIGLGLGLIRLARQQPAPPLVYGAIWPPIVPVVPVETGPVSLDPALSVPVVCDDVSTDA
jgi:hypothetical protein